MPIHARLNRAASGEGELGGDVCLVLTRLRSAIEDKKMYDFWSKKQLSDLRGCDLGGSRCQQHKT